MTTNARDVQALTYLAKRLRDETHGANHWDEAGIHAVITKLAGRNLALTIEQVVRHAADVNAKTPGAINRPFLPDPPERSTTQPPRRTEECRTHLGEYAHNCRACAADRLAGVGYGHDDDPPATGTHTPQTIRQQLRGRAREEA